ncbi:Hpt domain-containing protein [Legionella steelei]|nr:Hpt domain-containing protein [Legionella steelei]
MSVAMRVIPPPNTRLGGLVFFESSLLVAEVATLLNIRLPAFGWSPSFIPKRHETPAVDLSKARKDLPDSDDEMFQLNKFPILNSDEALKNCATHEMLKELLTLMTQELPTDLECMNNAFKALDYPLVEKTAHKIKGRAVYVGTIRMKYACQYVERYWKTGQRELFDALYHQAVSTIEETITYIEG